MHFLIDGHNLIGQMPNLHLSDPDDEAQLLDILRRFRARTGHRLTVVFDAGQTYHPAQTKKHGGLTVQFVSHTSSADAVIRRRVRRIQNPQGWKVVSSDRAVQQAAELARVRVVPAAEFARELLAPPPPTADEGAEVQLSAAEVDEWLSIFEQGKTS